MCTYLPSMHKHELVLSRDYSLAFLLVLFFLEVVWNECVKRRLSGNHVASSEVPDKQVSPVFLFLFWCHDAVSLSLKLSMYASIS